MRSLVRGFIVSFICIVPSPMEVGYKAWLQKWEFFRKERLSFLVSRMGIPGFIHRWVVRKGAFSNRKLAIDLLIGLVQAVENGVPDIWHSSWF